MFFVSALLVLTALALSVIVGIVTLFRSQSNIKNYFLLMQAAIITYLIGYLMMVTGTAADESFTGLKVMYVGAYLIPVFAFFSLCAFCDVKLHMVCVKIPMAIPSLAAIILMWTSNFHKLMILDYYTNVRGLRFVRGPLYTVFQLYPTSCLILCIIMVLYHITKWDKKQRKGLFLILTCLAIPFLSETIYFILLMSGRTAHYYTPQAMAIMGFWLYMGVIRYNMLELISSATYTAMENIKEGYILLDENNGYLASNPSALMIFPGLSGLAKGEPVSLIRHWPAELSSHDIGTVEFSITVEKIKFYKASINPMPVKKQKSPANIILLKDITESKNAVLELEKAAYTDSLTGFYKRKRFFELACVEIERARRMNQSVFTAMLDIDFFKQVNDVHGHAAGDLVLKSTAGIISRTVRSYDLSGRFGGEEFVILITNLDPPEELRLMERTRENIEKNVVSFEGKEIKVTCSIGLSQLNKDETLEMSLIKADEALYLAKNAGRNQVMKR